MRLYEFGHFDNNKPAEPHIQWHMIDDHSATIDKIDVPVSRKGLGSAFYRQWEDNLPPNVTYIELWSHVGNIPFWQKMGYTIKYPAIKLGHDDGTTLFKKL
jgi:hypothetical protein